MLNMRGKKWSELSTAQRVVVVALGVAEVVLAAIAITDLARRPAEQVRGKKWMWGPAMSINFVGPLSYLVFGRVAGDVAPADAVVADEPVRSGAEG